MYTKRFFYALLALFIVTGCQKKQESKLPIIDARSERKADFTKIVSDYMFIFPEATENSLIGLGIERIEIYDNKIFVLNRTSSGRNIKCFDTNGKFLYTIDRRGKGPGEYELLTDFFIDKFKNNLVLYAGKFMYFDFNGNLLNEKIPERHLYLERIYSFDDSTYFISNDSEVELKYDLIKVDNRTFDIVDSLFSYTHLSNFKPILPISEYNNRILYCPTDTIYDISDINNVNPCYIINYSESDKKLKDRILNSKSSSEDNTMMLILNFFKSGKMNITCSVFENDRFVIVDYWQAVNNRFEFPDDYYVLFSKKEKKPITAVILIMTY